MTIPNKTFHPIMTITIKAQEELPPYRFVDFRGMICQQNQKALGATVGRWSSNKYAGIIVLGTAIVEAGSTITIGDKIASNAEGKAVPATTGAEVNGRALNSANAGEFVRVLLVP
ncbi:MAG: capsid cement protein [Candidatus Kapaibacteriota bacterium]